MKEIVYSTIKEGKRIAISVPFDWSILDTEEALALAQTIHDDMRERMQRWFDEEFARSL